MYFNTSHFFDFQIYIIIRKKYFIFYPWYILRKRNVSKYALLFFSIFIYPSDYIIIYFFAIVYNLFYPFCSLLFDRFKVFDQRGIANRIFFSLFSFMRAQHVLSYHLIQYHDTIQLVLKMTFLSYFYIKPMRDRESVCVCVRERERQIKREKERKSARERKREINESDF